MATSPLSQTKLPSKESRHGWRYGTSVLLLSVALFSVAFALLRLQWALRPRKIVVGSDNARG